MQTWLTQRSNRQNPSSAGRSTRNQVPRMPFQTTLSVVSVAFSVFCNPFFVSMMKYFIYIFRNYPWKVHERVKSNIYDTENFKYIWKNWAGIRKSSFVVPTNNDYFHFKGTSNYFLSDDQTGYAYLCAYGRSIKELETKVSSFTDPWPCLVWSYSISPIFVTMKTNITRACAAYVHPANFLDQQTFNFFLFNPADPRGIT